MSMSAHTQGSGSSSTLPHTSVDNFSFANLSLTDTLEDLARYFTAYPFGSANRTSSPADSFLTFLNMNVTP